jgi:hypothetical protein
LAQRINGQRRILIVGWVLRTLGSRGATASLARNPNYSRGLMVDE